MNLTAKLAAIAALAFTAALAVPAAGHASTTVDTSKTYMITTTRSTALDIAGASRGDGAALIQWGLTGNGNQQWKFDPVGDDKYRIRNLNSNKCLTAPGGAIARGTKIVQWVCGRAGQEWRYYSAMGESRSGTLVLGGGYTMPSGETYHPALDMPENSGLWGTQFQIWTSALLDDPTFGFNYSSSAAQTLLLVAFG
jgi:hypothetical protein